MKIKLIIFTAMLLFCSSAAANAQVAATVNGREISQSEIDATITPQLLPLEQQIFALRKAALDNYVTRLLLENEAKRRGLTLEALKKQLTDIKVEIPAAEVEASYLENAMAFAQMSPEEAKERIRLDMETQARMRGYREAINKLRQSSQVAVKIKEPVLPVAVNEGGFTTGSENSSVTIVEYADFTCRFCRQASSIVTTLIKQYKDDVKFVFKNLPLSAKGEALSRAAYCAGRQGKFWEYHDSLFASENITDGVLSDLAVRHNLDAKQFSACQSSPDSLQAVRREASEAKRLGIDGTPAFIINGKLITGAPSLEEFKTILDAALLSRAQALNK